MKLSLSQEMSVEFDEQSLAIACGIIQDIKKRHGAEASGVLDSLLTALVFRQIENTTPGTVNQLIKACAVVKS